MLTRSRSHGWSGLVEGILGVLHLDGDRRPDADALGEVATSCGVSDASVVVSGNFGMACSRRDIDNNRQAPGVATAAGGALHAAMTGELDNREALERELRGAGACGGESDAELALALYQSWGDASVARLSGFFNLTIWDARAQRMLLVVDRCGGLRSMYWTVADDTLIFASSLKLLVANPRVPRRVDARALDEVLSLGHAIPPRTLIEGVWTLAGGTLLDVRERRHRIHAYARPGRVDEASDSEEVLQERYFHALTTALARTLDTRPQPGVLLSGGVDSAVLVSLMRRAGVDGITTVSVHTGSAEAADAAASERVARLYGTDHHPILDLDESCLDELPTMLWHYEAPAQSIHPTYWLSRTARQHCDSVIAGYGNDLVWGCSPPRKWLRSWPSPLIALACRHRYLRNRRLIGRRQLRRMFIPAPRFDAGLLRGIRKVAVATGSQFFDMVFLDTLLFGNLRVYREVGTLLVEGAGLPVRLPYADGAVKSVAASIPVRLRMARDERGGWMLKRFFKRFAERYDLLPHDLIHQRKKWMRPPTAEWLRGPLGQTVEGLLLDERTLDRGQLDREGVKAALHEHRAGVTDHSVGLMSLVGLELWQRIFIDPARVTAPAVGLREIVGEAKA